MTFSPGRYGNYYYGHIHEYVFASKCLKVNSHTMLKGRSQFDEEALVRDRRNASKRIHVERIIGCAKTFNIMKTTLNSEEASMGGKIMCVLHANEFQAVNLGYNLSLLGVY